MSAAERTDVELRCETCGNRYESTFVVEKDGRRHRFDSFECAIHALAPTCPRCEVRVVGHGVQVDDRIYCSSHCARESEPAGAALATHT